MADSRFLCLLLALYCSSFNAGDIAVDDSIASLIVQNAIQMSLRSEEAQLTALEASIQVDPSQTQTQTQMASSSRRQRARAPTSAAVAPFRFGTQSASQIPAVPGGVGASKSGEFPCLTAMKKMCDPCPRGTRKGYEQLCDRIEIQCRKLMCKPLCLKLTWGAEVKVSSKKCKAPLKCSAFQQEVQTQKYQQAIIAELVAQGCVNVAGCCKENGRLLDWVDYNVYGDDFPFPNLPIPSCKHDPADVLYAQDLCKACRKAIKVKLHTIDCENFKAETDGKSASSEAAEVLLEMDAQASTRMTAYKEYYDLFLQEQELRSQLNLKGNDKKKGPPLAVDKPHIEPAFKSFKERCEVIKDMIETRFTSMIEDFNQRICNCLGCCRDALCYFPMTEDVDPPKPPSPPPPPSADAPGAS
eukprot:GILK01008545.1.p1 GENE.GILK01008545.1~~GILK01008545.1.p1  ORF type:complete len:413 (-),score=63.85 GILK01008545.1:86-1324(-)